MTLFVRDLPHSDTVNGSVVSTCSDCNGCSEGAACLDWKALSEIESGTLKRPQAGRPGERR
ncbi:MAG: hypothetical protein RLZZ444_450 [Pseudomonadota bacterium]|jgi:hypothetical protein